MPEKLLRITEVARILDVTEDRAYALARAGILPVVRIGRHLRVDPEALQKWIRAGGQSFEGGWRKQAVAN